VALSRVALAARFKISPSQLKLIERNKRKTGGVMWALKDEVGEPRSADAPPWSPTSSEVR
jgi:hypothetical protein